MLKKIISLVLVIAITASIAVSGTMAYLTSEDDDVNVMTLGNVKIVQHEYERVVDENGAYKTGTVDNQNSYTLKEFTQEKPLYPIVGDPSKGEAGWDSTIVRMTQVDSYGNMQVFAGKNAQDKFVTVENTGSSDAYIRTLVAVEIGTANPDLIGTSYHNTWSKTDIGDIEIDGVTYHVFEYLYNGGQLSDGSWRHENGVLPAGDTSYPNLAQVYLKAHATNEDMEAIDGNGDGNLNILVLSQAVQAAGFADAALAFETAFPKGDNNISLAEWFGGVIANNASIAPENTQAIYNETVYDDIYEAVAAANANGGGTITLLGSAKLDKSVEITSDITIKYANNARQAAAQTRAEGYTGTMYTVTGATLTMENVVLDGAGATATGNLIVAEANGHIVLGEGTVLQNNIGAHAVNLGTRIGATLTLNGAEICNNSSDSGAIWGGGDITINSGKINNNSSTGSAGAIRMVGKCNLTMNGGEICGNTAAADGGAIWGYGINGNTSVYNLNSGKISGNTAGGTGGGIYTGTYSTVNISGDFEMCDNTATDSGAMRITNYTIVNLNGGKISGNTSTNNSKYNGFYGWCPRLTISDGELDDNIYLAGGHTPTVGGGKVTGIIYFNIGTNHNTTNLKADFNGFKFYVMEDDNFAAFNFKPAAGYTYTAGDEAKLVCLNEGYSTYWDAVTGTFRLQAN